MESNNPIVANAMAAKNAEVDGKVLVEFTVPSISGPQKVSKKMSNQELEMFFQKNKIGNYQQALEGLSNGGIGAAHFPMIPITMRLA